MQIRLVGFLTMLLTAGAAAEASPVAYTLQFGSASQETFGFTLVAPGYIANNQTVSVSPNQLSNLVFKDPDSSDSLFNVSLSGGLSSGAAGTYVIDYLQVDIANSAEGESLSQVELTNGPGGTNAYLDRDGSYTFQFVTQMYGRYNITGRPVTLTVTATPEPAVWPVTGVAAAALLALRRRLGSKR